MLHRKVSLRPSPQAESPNTKMGPQQENTYEIAYVWGNHCGDFGCGFGGAPTAWLLKMAQPRRAKPCIIITS